MLHAQPLTSLCKLNPDSSSALFPPPEARWLKYRRVEVWLTNSIANNNWLCVLIPGQQLRRNSPSMLLMGDGSAWYFVIVCERIRRAKRGWDCWSKKWLCPLCPVVERKCALRYTFARKEKEKKKNEGRLFTGWRNVEMKSEERQEKRRRRFSRLTQPQLIPGELWRQRGHRCLCAVECITICYGACVRGITFGVWYP